MQSHNLIFSATTSTLCPHTALSLQHTRVDNTPLDMQHEQQLSLAPRLVCVKPKPRTKRRKRSLIVPMSKIERQRSMEFNLGLDINNLRQEVQNLLHLREILVTKALVARTSPTGSLMRMVRKFYTLFQRTVRQPQVQDGTGNLAEFLAVMMIDDVDCYNGCTGRDTILTQYRNFCDYMGFLGMGMDRFEISTSNGDDDLVVISTSGILRSRVTRETLAALFPHILSYEELCAQLVGKNIAFPCTVQFIFNGDDKVCVFQVDIDFVAGLSTTLGPGVIALVLDNARIAHSMLCIEDEPGDIDQVSATARGDEELESVATVLSGEPIGELPSLFALDEPDGTALASAHASVLPIDVAELLDF